MLGFREQSSCREYLMDLQIVIEISKVVVLTVALQLGLCCQFLCFQVLVLVDDMSDLQVSKRKLCEEPCVSSSVLVQLYLSLTPREACRCLEKSTITV